MIFNDSNGICPKGGAARRFAALGFGLFWGEGPPYLEPTPSRGLVGVGFNSVALRASETVTCFTVDDCLALGLAQAQFFFQVTNADAAYFQDGAQC